MYQKQKYVLRRGTWLKLTENSPLPVPTLTANPTEPIIALFGVTITFNEPVTGFAIGDITVTGGSASNFAGSGANYTVDITPSFGSVSSVSISIAAAVCIDSDGNDNLASNVLTYDVPVFYDTFDDTNGASLDAHSPNWGGGSWVEAGGDWSINTNRALTTSATNSRGTNTLSDQMGALHGVFSPGASASAAFLFRGVDASNYWLAVLNANVNEVRLVEVTGATPTTRDSASLSLTGSNYYSVVVTDDGTNMAMSVAGAPYVSYSSTAKNTGKAVGCYSSANTASRFEEILVLAQ